MSTFGANDALYGTGTYGTARYGRVTPVISISGVVGTTSIGTSEIQPTEALVSVSATGSIGIVEVKISKTGKDKWTIEFFKSMADQFGLSQQGKGKYKPVKVVKNVEGNMLHSTFKGYLGI